MNPTKNPAQWQFVVGCPTNILYDDDDDAGGGGGGDGKITPNVWSEEWFLIGFTTLPDLSNRNYHAMDFEAVIIGDMTDSDQQQVHDVHVFNTQVNKQAGYGQEALVCSDCVKIL